MHVDDDDDDAAQFKYVWCVRQQATTAATLTIATLKQTSLGGLLPQFRTFGTDIHV